MSASEEPAADSVVAAPRGRQRSSRPWLRVAILALLIGAGWGFVLYTGALESFEEEQLRALVSEAGALGVGLYVVAFVAAQALHLPGAVFIAVASVAWGWLPGTAVALLASVVSVGTNFLIVRTIGGDLLVDVERPLLARILRHLHRRPRLAIFLARAAFMTSPWLTTTLALSGVRHRDHLLASTLGMMPQIVVWTAAVDFAVTKL